MDERRRRAGDKATAWFVIIKIISPQMSSASFVLFLVAACLTSSLYGVKAQCDNGEVKTMRAQTMLRTFSSPNYPDHYPSNSFCQWLLAAPNDDYVVRLDAIRMDLEATQGCIYDSITLYNGNSTETPEQRRFCAGYFSLYSTGRYLLVIFESDDNVEGRGFQFRFFALAKNPPTVRTTTMSTTTQAAPKKGKNWVNTGALIGGVVGGVCFVIILGLICGRCVGRGGPRQPPIHRPAAFYHSHAPPLTPLHEAGDATTITTALHMVQNNNAVFMVSQAMGSNVSPTRFTSTITNGVTNMVFDGDGEPPAGIVPMGLPGPPVGVPPPCYKDSMLVTHPPAIPPSPRRMFSAPGNAGLAPPPLFAPRENGVDPSELDQPGPSTSNGEGSWPPQQPVPTISIEISPPEPEDPQQVVQTTSLQASPSALPNPGPSTSAQDLAAGASQIDERQNELDSTSSGPVTETPPSQTVSHTSSSQEESATLAESSTQPEGNVENCSPVTETHDTSQENSLPVTEPESCEEPQQIPDSQPCVEHETTSCDETVEPVPVLEESAPTVEITHGTSMERDPAPSVSSSQSETLIDPNQTACAVNTTDIQSETNEDMATRQNAVSTTESDEREIIEENREHEEICSKPSTASLDESSTVPSVDCENTRQGEDSTAQCDSGASEGHPVSQGEKSMSFEHQPETAVNLTEVSEGAGSQQDISTKTTPSEATKKPSDSSEDVSGEPSQDTCEMVVDAPVSPDLLHHHSAERSASSSSLPPPPSPHSCAVSDSESENFPPPPVPYTVESGGDPQQASSTCSPLHLPADTPVPPDDDTDLPAVAHSPVALPDGLPPDAANSSQDSQENITPSCLESDSFKPPVSETVCPSDSSLNLCEADCPTIQNSDLISQPVAGTTCLTTVPDSPCLPDAEEPAIPPESDSAKSSAVEESAQLTSDSPRLSTTDSPVLLKATSSTSLADTSVPPVADESVLPTAESPHLSHTEQLSEVCVPAVMHSSNLSIPEVLATSDEDHTLPAGAEASSLRPAGSSSSLLQTLPPNEAGTGQMGEGCSQEELYAAQSFASLSSQSSPMLTERQLRNSTSVPDIKGQVDVIKREAFQRADSQ